MESPHRLLSKTEIREALGNWVGLEDTLHIVPSAGGLEDTRHTTPSAGGLTLLPISAMRAVQIDHLGGCRGLWEHLRVTTIWGEGPSSYLQFPDGTLRRREGT